jgi:micrococcal nuclease
MFNYLTRKYYERRFNKLDIENINFFSFEGLKTYCFVSSIYDGDTVNVVFYHKREPIKYKVRLYGIDTPEIRTRDKKEKELGYKARDYLREIMLEKTVLVEFMKYDKYGRILGVFYDKNNNNINKIMVDNGYAKEYFGGTK